MRRRLTAFVVLIFLFSSCFNKQDEQADTSDTTTSSQLTDSAEFENISVSKSAAIWSVDYDTATNEFHLRKNKQVSADSLDINGLIQSVNQAWQPLTITLLGVSNDTINIKLNDANAMSSDMGSAGSEQFIAAVTYTLTEMKNIHYVNFVFPSAGDHAEPGVYSREDFMDFMKKQ